MGKNIDSEAELLKVIHELHVHQIELEVQNEELMLAKSAAQVATDNYIELYDFAPSGYVTLSASGEIRKLNHACARLLGKERSRLVNKNFGLFVSLDFFGDFNAFLRNVFEGPARATCEVMLTSDSKSPVYIHIEGILSRNRRECQATLVNVTAEKQAAGLLKKSNQYNTLILEAAGEGIIGIDLDGNHTFANPMAVELLGYSTQELLGKNSHHLFHHHHPDGTVYDYGDCPIQATLLSGKPYRGEDYFVRKNGMFFPVEFSSLPIFDDFKITGAVVTFSDITVRRQSEETLKQSLQKWETMISASPDGIGMVSLDGKLQFMSDRLAAMYGYSAEEKDGFIGHSIFNFIDPSNHHLLADSINKLLTGEISHKVSEYLSVKKDGSRFYVEVTSTVLNDSSGKPASILYFQRDITERKGAVEALRRLSQAVEQSPVMTCITDLQGTIEYVNPKASEITGYTREELTGKNPRILKSGKKPREGYEELWQAISSGREWKGEFQNKKKNGELYWVSAAISPVIEDGGKISHYLAVEEDITERKKAEMEVQDLNANLELKITERTAQLADTIEILNREIMERTQADEALRWNQSLLQMMANSSPLGFLVVDNRTDNILYFNQRFCQIWGIEHLAERMRLGELKNNDIIPDCLPVLADVPAFAESCKPLQDEENRITIEDEIAFTENRTIQRFSTQIRGEHDEYFGRFYIFEDITERKRVEADLEEGREKYRGLSEASFEAIFISEKGLCIEQNLAAEKMFGYTSEEALARYGTDWIAPEDREMVMKNILSGNEEPYEATAIKKDGTTFPCVLRARMMHYKGRNVRVTSLTDISDRKQAEEKVKQVSTRLALAARAGGVGVWDYDIVGDILLWDDQMFALYGVAKEDFNGVYEVWRAGVHPDDQDRGDAEIQMAIRGEKEFDTEFRVVRPDGSIRNIRALAVVQRDASGKPLHLVGTNWDITAQKQTEALIDQTRQNYETFFNTLDDFLFVLDEQGNIIHTNDTVLQRLGYTAEELADQSVLMVHPEERREEAGRIVAEMLAGTADFCPVPLITKSGSRIPVETRVKPGFWNGKPVIFGWTKDVSKIKLSEEKFSKAFQSNSALMAISGFENGEYIDVNDMFLNTLDYSRDEIIGKTSLGLNLFVNSTVRKTILKRIVNNEPVRDMELEVRTKSGGIITGLFSAESIYIGTDLCLLTVMVDISERKRAEEEIGKARNEAEKANLAKSEFLSRMSHELRTPMNSILGFAQLMEMGVLSAAHKKGVNHILNSGRHLLNLINEVLDISKIEAGRLSLSLEPVQLKGIIDEMTDSVYPHASAMQLTLELENSPSDLLFVKCDSHRLKQVLLNLLNNAIKYNRMGGSVFIRTALMPEGDSGYVPVRISIQDTGTGITPEDIPKLFKPFERIGAEKSGTEGTGLGLTVVKKLMEAMGGTVGVESMPGSGSTFWIELPQAQDQSDQNNQAGRSIGEEALFTGKAGTILYIEDNISNIELVEHILTIRRSGIRVIANANGGQAVDLAVENAPDLILLDLDLPDIHGSEVMAKLQADARTRSIPVVIISADAMPGQIERLMNAGARDYLTKPLDITMFLQMVDEWVSF